MCSAQRARGLCPLHRLRLVSVAQDASAPASFFKAVHRNSVADICARSSLPPSPYLKAAGCPTMHAMKPAPASAGRPVLGKSSYKRPGELRLRRLPLYAGAG